ncbi:MAG: class I SAM-dependent methyltransferase [Gemmatimonadota bacterium]
MDKDILTRITRASVLEENAQIHDRLSRTHERLASHVAKPNCRAFYHQLITEILERFHIHPQRVLELGCGTASYADLFAGSYTGVDVSKGMIDVARQRVPRGEFHVCSAEEFLAQGQGFDLIFSSSFVHHVHDVDDLFMGISGSLCPGGAYVAIHEPLRKSFDVDKRALSEIVDEAVGILCGWYSAPMPFARRVHKAVTVALSHLHIGRAGDEDKIDLVDFQLNGDFSPSSLHHAAVKSGLRGYSLIYSFLRYGWIRKVCGGSRNYFAFVAVRER